VLGFKVGTGKIEEIELIVAGGTFLLKSMVDLGRFGV
jgi:hypothetical protein